MPSRLEIQRLAKYNHPMAKILFTGFPGFLGSKLLPHAPVIAMISIHRALCRSRL